MGLKKHGITSETIKNMILGAGVIYKNLKYEKPSNGWTGTPLGATSGGLKFNYEAPIILTALMGYIVWLLKNQKKDRDANSKGTMLLLRVQLIEYHTKYMMLQEIPSYAYENFCEMYDAYHALGGNGMITKMKREIDELHLRRKVDEYGTNYKLY